MEGFSTWITTREDLVISKLLWAKDSLSELQLRDVKNLLATASEVDLEYLERWTKELEVFRLLQQCQK